MAFAKTKKGQSIKTGGGQKTFKVEVEGVRFKFLLDSENERTESFTNTEKFLAIFNQSRSMKPSDYQECTFNASYLLGLIQAYDGRSIMIR